MGRYENSDKWWKRALKVIPMGAQTISKSTVVFPKGASPLFIKKGKKGHVWDIDGNEYVDLVSSLGAVNLGHLDPDVTAAVKAQLGDGTLFSLPHPLETIVAEKIIGMVPGAEAVRFGKNGSDATSGAIRVARAAKRRDRVAVCGYHGWHDWYIGSTPTNLGVPKATARLTHRFEYNEIDTLLSLMKKHPGDFAAVIMEPMNMVFPEDDFLHKVKEVAHKNGALFILDELVTGFRFANGGAQEYFDITADLSTFGKGLANGYPLSALAGKERYMRLIEKIFFSLTGAGETMSLAAASATLTKLKKKPILKNLAVTGTKLNEGVQKIIAGLDLDEMTFLSGHPAWTFIFFQEYKGYSSLELQTLFRQEMFANGILLTYAHILNHGHTAADIAKTLRAYEKTLTVMKAVCEDGTLHRRLRCKPLTPSFKVR